MVTGRSPRRMEIRVQLRLLGAGDRPGSLETVYLPAIGAGDGMGRKPPCYRLAGWVSARRQTKLPHRKGAHRVGQVPGRNSVC
jgi:hypothetical protein